MSTHIAYHVAGLSVEERKARLAALVATGQVTVEAAALIDFREPTEEVIQHGLRLAAKLKAARADRARAGA